MSSSIKSQDSNQIAKCVVDIATSEVESDAVKVVKSLLSECRKKKARINKRLKELEDEIVALNRKLQKLYLEDSD